MTLVSPVSTQVYKTAQTNFAQSYVADGSVAVSLPSANSYVRLQNVFGTNDVQQNCQADGYTDGYVQILQGGYYEVVCALEGSGLADGYVFEASLFQNGIAVKPGKVTLSSVGASTAATVSGTVHCLVFCNQGDILDVRLQTTSTDANGVTFTVANATFMVMSL